MNIRHGDIRLKKIKTLPNRTRELEDKVLAYGTVTGHSHRFEKPDLIKRYSRGKRLYLVVLKEAELIHEEHKTLIIPKGVYEQIQEIERDPFLEMIRQVID